MLFEPYKKQRALDARFNLGTFLPNILDESEL